MLSPRSMTDAERLLSLLWDRYATDVPWARTFVALGGGTFHNDHVAFRSLKFPDRAGDSGIAVLQPVFERLGWQKKDSYDFPDAMLDAIYLAHPEGLPRVFLSQIRVDRFPAPARRLLATLPADPPPPHGDVTALAQWFDAPSQPPREETLLGLEEVSQYAAWVYAFGRRVNHFTGAVDDVELWQKRMQEAGVPMKETIEGEKGHKLRQTATFAAPVKIPLAGGGEREWPYAYFEIAERNGGFDGFLGPQARQLFDMTARR